MVKHLWNIHLKTDSLWIKWIHHFYLSSLLIWDVQAKKASSPLWKTLVSLKDQLVQDCGSSSSIVTTMTSWSAGTGCFSANAYEHFRMKGSTIHWDKVVWEPWSLPKHCFVLWIAVLGRLRIKVRLHFIPTDTSCVFCSQDQESHSHLFFKCP